jgi:hypothetical protein
VRKRARHVQSAGPTATATTTCSWEIVDNSVDEANGHATRIEVILDKGSPGRHGKPRRRAGGIPKSTCTLGHSAPR